ncbi:MAG: alpha/beta fold hydrolase [Mesorhizobium sp.]|nr:alpha/beta fold hydrolase [Mesorhizobium sp.]
MLHVHASGDPQSPAIVFLHALATSSWMWQEQTALLPDFRCLCVDLPGHGLSNAIAWRSFDDAADQIADVIRARSPNGRAHVVGLSLGSYVGLTLISRHADCVDRAVLSGLNVLPLPHLWLMDALGYVMAPLLKTGFGARMNAKALNIPEDRVEAYRQSLRQVATRAFIDAGHEASRFAMPANLASVATPTLLLAGQNEHALIHDSMAALRATLPDATARWAPNAGHGWPGELPELFSATVRAWCLGASLPPKLLSARTPQPV